MPGEQTPDDYYLYYHAAQRRVEQWVKHTDEELHKRQGSTAAQGTVPAAASAAAPAARQGKTEPTPLATASSPPLDHRHEKQARPSSSSKHRTEDRSSRSRPSSGSKKIRPTPDVPHTKPASRESRRDPPRKASTTHDSGDITIFSCLPYGAFPLVYAMTGSFGLSAVVAVVLVAVCVSINRDAQDSSSSSRKRNH